MEFIAAIFSLPAELLTRRGMGRRYFTLLGLVGCYVVWSLALGVASMFSLLDEWRTVEFNVTGGGPSQAELAARAQSAAGIELFWQVFFLLGLGHKAAMLYRKQRRRSLTNTAKVSSTENKDRANKFKRPKTNRPISLTEGNEP